MVGFTSQSERSTLPRADRLENIQDYRGNDTTVTSYSTPEETKSRRTPEHQDGCTRRPRVPYKAAPMRPFRQVDGN